MISFNQLIGEGGKEGAREKFERLVAQLVILQIPTARRLGADPGDWGVDVFAGEIDDVISVWQAKFFIDGVEGSQQDQIRDSFKQVLAKSKSEGFDVDVWTLCIPVDLGPKAEKWWVSWRRRQKAETGVRIELWDRTRLENLLLAPDAAGILSHYFPTMAPAVAQLPQVLDLPEDIRYDDMLFVQQLEAAHIREHSSAKQQFFNAELLSRDVVDKRIPEHVQALQAERADLRSIWEDRYNRACAQPASQDGLLPALHPDVMEAIERRHNGGDRVSPLPMHLVHRKGAMHQVVQSGQAGWIKDYRRLVNEASQSE